MAYYRNIITEEIRELDPDLISSWVAANNPKASQWEPYTPPPEPPAPPPSPDYINFYTALVQSQVYQQVLTQATQSTELLAYLLAFTSALSDAKSGRPNPPELQNSINLIMSAITLTPQELQELGGLMSQYHLDQVYTLP